MSRDLRSKKSRKKKAKLYRKRARSMRKSFASPSWQSAPIDPMFATVTMDFDAPIEEILIFPLPE
jgi:hypothetical protein